MVSMVTMVIEHMHVFYKVIPFFGFDGKTPLLKKGTM